MRLLRGTGWILPGELTARYWCQRYLSFTRTISQTSMRGLYKRSVKQNHVVFFILCIFWGWLFTHWTQQFLHFPVPEISEKNLRWKRSVQWRIVCCQKAMSATWGNLARLGALLRTAVFVGRLGRPASHDVLTIDFLAAFKDWLDLTPEKPA